MTLSLGSLELAPGKAVVAVSFTDADAAADIAAARSAGVDLSELRIDLFTDQSPGAVATTISRLAGLPTLATIRLAAEGGGWSGDEAERLALYESLLPLVDGVDVELRAGETLARLGPQARAQGRLLVVSHHDFTATPDGETLSDIARRAVAAGADIVKIATQVRDDEDFATLARLLEAAPAPHMVVIGMGEKGLPTRIAFPHEGSLFTFAGKGERLSAPGQVSYQTLIPLLGRAHPRA